MRHLVGYTEEARQRYRDEALTTTAADFRALADILDRLNAAGEVVVLGSPDALAAAQAESGIDLTITKVL